MSKGIDISRIKDFPYYSSNLLKIKTNMFGPDGEEVERVIPFVLNETQWKLHRAWEHQLATVGYVRIIVLKARRPGISTYVEGRVFQRVHTTPNTHAFIVAHDKGATNTIFEMSRLFYESLPKRFKPMKRYSSKKELVFENPDEKSRFANPGLRSKIEVFPANSATSIRSGGYSCGHFSEVAFFPDDSLFGASASPTIPDIVGSFIVYESTAFGRGGFFHQEWLKATTPGKKRTNFFPIFFSWLEFASYVKKFNDGCSLKELLATLDPEEKELMVKYKATPPQLHWRRHKIFDLEDDLDLFHQEYPTTPEEAFISSGQPYFNRRKVQKLIDNAVDPEWRGEMTPLGFVENEDGPLMMWEKPEKDYDYMLGVDVGGGSDDGDPSVIEVFKVPKGQPILVQVAEWWDICDPVVLAGKVISLATYYNMATVSPEINNHGLTLLNEVKNHYFNIYRWQYFDRYGKYLTNKLGWETNMSTRPLLCDYTSACLNADILIIRSRELAGEMMSFIKRASQGGEADAGCYDDRVMAFMICIFCLAHSNLNTTLLQSLGLHTDPIVEEGKPRMIMSPTDHDYDMMDLASERKSMYEGSMGWLNY